MKILYASDAYYPRTHGVAVCIDSSANYLAEKGHQVYIVTPEYPIKDNRVLHPNISLSRYKSYRLFFTTNKEERFIYPSEIKKIYRYLEEVDPDVIHIHLEFIIGYAVRKWAMDHSKPIVMTAYTYYPPYIKLYIPYLPKKLCFYISKRCSKWFYAPSDLLFALTKEMEEVLIRDYNVKNHIERLLIGVDEKDFMNFDRKKEKCLILEQFPKLKNKNVLLFVGRIGKEKNVDFLLYVMKEILKGRNDTELLMVGGGSYMDKFQNKAKSLGIYKHVTFVGSIPHRNIRKFFALGDIFVFPSVTEAQGLVTAEALYLGLPVVAVNALGTKTVLENERGGFLVDENVKSFTNKVNLLLNDKEIYERKRVEALERGQELTFSNTFEGVISKYESLAKRISIPV